MGMDARQILLRARRLCVWIKTVYSKKFIGSVIKAYCWVKDPSAHMAKALRLGEIECDSLRRLIAPTSLLFGVFSVLDLDSRFIREQTIDNLVKFQALISCRMVVISSQIEVRTIFGLASYTSCRGSSAPFR